MKSYSDKIREVLFEQPDDAERDPVGDEGGAARGDVAAVDDRGDDARVRGRASDAELFERLDEARLGIARRRARLVALRLEQSEVEDLADRQRRQRAVLVGRGILLVALLVVALFVGGEEPAERDDRARRRELGGAVLCRRGRDRDGSGGSAGVGHLRRDRPLPDEVVQLELVATEHVAQLGRGAERLTRRTDRLVGFLRVLGLAGVDAGLLGDRVGAVQLRRLAARGRDRLLRQRRRVGAHIGDVPVLVQTLRHAHGLAGREAELAGRLLLQCRGRERCRRPARVRLGLEVAHRERGRRQAQGVGECLGRGLVQRDDVAGELPAVVVVAAAGDALAVDAGELRLEAGTLRAGLRQQFGREVPVGGGDEGEPLALAVDDEAGRGGLHPAGGETGADLAPQHGRHLVAVETVEDAAGLLRVDEGGVELARVVAGGFDRVLGDLVEDHALDGDLRLQHLEQVPRDRLAFAVFIGGEVELVGVLEGLLEVGDRSLLLVAHHVIRKEAVLDVDRELAERALLQLRRQVLGLDQVADVPHRGLHLVAVAEVLGDGLRLRRRLDDHQFLAVGHFAP